MYPPHRQLRRRGPRTIVAAILLLALLPPAPARTATAADDEAAFTPVSETTAEMQTGSVAWQASILPTVDDVDQAALFAAGFLYAGDGAVVVSRPGSERTTRLRQGIALPVEAGSRLAPVSFTGAETEFPALSGD